MASALFHVLWNTFLKASQNKPRSVTLMMCITVLGIFGYTYTIGALEEALAWPILTSALIAGFFFFLYQYFVAQAYAEGDLSQVYPLTVTGPIYIALWSVLLLDEKISLLGGLGILCIVYGAMTIQTNTLYIHLYKLCKQLPKKTGILSALLAAFFYSFGAIADKVGVTVGNFSAYTLDLCIFMLIFHLIRMRFKHQLSALGSEMQKNSWPIILGGVAMLLSFITFRVGLQEVQASYASALRQVSTLFGLLLGYIVFKERFGPSRIISTLSIVLGTILIRLG